MKKILSIILAVVMLFCIAGCSAKSKEGAKPGTAYIDDCYIEITDCKRTDGMAVVYVNFKNDSSKETSLFFTANIDAYQNGKQLNGTSWIPSLYGIKYSYSDIVQPGYSLSTGYAFALDDSSAPITVQIKDGSHVISEKTFK